MHVLSHSQPQSSLYYICYTLSIALFPTIYFFTFLYYTDSLSLLLVMTSYLFALYSHGGTKSSFSMNSLGEKGRYVCLSAFFALLSIFMRQTNIVWSCFIGGTILFQRVSHLFFTHSIVQSLLALLLFLWNTASNLRQTAPYKRMDSSKDSPSSSVPRSPYSVRTLCTVSSSCGLSTTIMELFWATNQIISFLSIFLKYLLFPLRMF